MAIEKVREYFRGLGMEDRVIEFATSSATVELAAQASGTEPKWVKDFFPSFPTRTWLFQILPNGLPDQCASLAHQRVLLAAGS